MTSAMSRWADPWELPLIAAAMDAAWVTPYSLLLGSVWGRPGAPLLTPVSLFVLLAAAQVATRAMLARRTPVAHVRALLVLFGVAAAGMAVAGQYGGDLWRMAHGPFWSAADAALKGARPEVPAFVLAAVLWGRGIGVGRTDLEYSDVETIFQVGLAGFGVFAAGTALGSREPAIALIAAHALPYLIAFFAAGLIALPVARLRTIRRRTRASGQAMALSGDWFALIAGAVGAVLGVAVLGAALLRLDLKAIVTPVGRLVDPLLWILIYAIAVPLGAIVTGIIWVIRHFLRSGATPPPPRGFAPPRWIHGIPHGGAAGLPPVAAAALRWGVVSLLVCLIVLWLAQSVFRNGRLARDQRGEETRESVWSWRDLRAAFGAWLRRPPRPAEGRSSAPDFGTGPASLVRRTYAEVLALAAAQGHPRAPHHTPAEFIDTLHRAWPETAGDVERLTGVYNRVRYGLVDPSESDLAFVRTALVRIKTSGGPAAERSDD
jgi:Domain of unknown function (DUF4129)